MHLRLSVTHSHHQIEYDGDEGDVNMHVLDAINYLRDAWDAIISTIISNCYRKAGFRCNRPVEVVELKNELTESCNHLKH